MKQQARQTLERIFYAAGLNKDIYRDVAGSQQATGQAAVVVFLVGLAAGIGALDDDGLRALPVWFVTMVAGWLVWVTLAYLIGAKLLAGSGVPVTWGELARALGFAQSPGLLRSLGAISGLGPIVSLVAIVWQVVAMVVALREVLHYGSYWRATVVVVIALVPVLIIVGSLNLFLIRLL